MKNLLYTLLLIGSVSFAQDGYSLKPETYTEIKAKVLQLDSLSAADLANDIAGAAKTDYRLLKAEQEDNHLNYYYVPASLSEEAFNEALEMGCTSCLVVYFDVYDTGIRFNNVAGDYEDLFAVWKAEFLPSVTTELAESSFKYRDVKDKTTGVNIRLSNNGAPWEIRNNTY